MTFKMSYHSHTLHPNTPKNITCKFIDHAKDSTFYNINQHLRCYSLLKNLSRHYYQQLSVTLLLDT